MSLHIDPDSVTSVMIGGQWIKVQHGTFGVDAYEIIEQPPRYDPELDYDKIGPGRYYSEERVLLYGGGTGFQFTALPGEYMIAGPITAIQAISY